MSAKNSQSRFFCDLTRLCLLGTGRMFAQSPIDESHLLRILFEEEDAGLVIITAYIGARRQYEI